MRVWTGMLVIVFFGCVAAFFIRSGIDFLRKGYTFEYEWYEPELYKMHRDKHPIIFWFEVSMRFILGFFALMVGIYLAFRA